MGKAFCLYPKGFSRGKRPFDQDVQAVLYINAHFIVREGLLTAGNGLGLREEGVEGEGVALRRGHRAL